MDKVLKHEQNVTYLGVIVDLLLDWKDHLISHLTNKLNCNIRALYKLSQHLVNTDILVNLYYGCLWLIRPGQQVFHCLNHTLCLTVALRVFGTARDV